MTDATGHPGIAQIAITVSDVEPALEFYQGVLGLKFLFSAGPELAFLDAGGVRIMLSTPQGGGSIGHNSIIYYSVPNLPAAHKSAVDRGAEVEREPQLTAKLEHEEIWISFLRDPDGNLVGLMEERPF